MRPMQRTWVRGLAMPVMVAALAGCQPEGEVGQTRSGAVVVDGQTAWVADMDNGEIVGVNLISGAITACPVGLEPARLAQVGDLMLVSLVAEGEIVVLQTSAQGCDEVARIPVGAEPYGVVVGKGGDMAYAAVQSSGYVAEIGLDDFTVERKFTVPGRPRWVTMHPNGHILFVGTVFQGAFYLDLREQEPAPVPIGVPEVDRGVPETGEVNPTTPRLTGELALSPGDADSLAIPLLYTEHTSPVDADDGDQPVEPQDGGGYASGNLQGGLTRFNPAVVTMSLDGNGIPRPGTAVAMLVSGRLSATQAEGGRTASQAVELAEQFQPIEGGSGSTRGFDVAVAEEPAFFDTGLRFDESGAAFDAFGIRTDLARGYLSTLRFAPDGRSIYATVEGADALAVVPAKPVQSGQPFGGNVDGVFADDDPFFGDGAMVTVPTVLIRTGAGSTAVAFSDEGEAWSFSFIDRTLHQVSHDDVDTVFQGMIVGGAPLEVGTWYAPRRFDLGASLLSPDVLEGRRLFYSASHPNMTTAGAGVSCATCHFDGRNDGLTWTFSIGERQTPSLAGKVSQTAPVTWTSSVESVSKEAELTSQGRMGGHGITAAQTQAIAAYVDWTRAPIVPEGEPEAVARGRAVFERADTACATCHVGDAGTDNRSYAMHGLQSVNTPTLRGLVATAPYLHDGAAASLPALVEMADDIGMGHTRQLSAQEKADLVAYLETR